jgi:gliding motility-associated-like protein
MVVARKTNFRNVTPPMHENAIVAIYSKKTVLKSFWIWLTLVFCALSSGVWSQDLQANFVSIPSFENNTLIICENEPVAFISTTVGDGPLATYQWEFGFGATPAMSSMEGPVVVEYTTATTGTTATLTVDNNDESEPSAFSISVVVLQAPYSDLTLNPAETGFTQTMADGLLTITRCDSDGPQTLSLSCNFDESVTQNFDWGDGTINDSELAIVDDLIAHEYPVGDFILEHTVQFKSGCADVRLYRIFNGSAPIVTISGSGLSTCTPSVYELGIISNSVPIDYTISYSDIPNVVSFNTANDTLLEHVFIDNSCGEEYVISPVLPPIENAHSATLIASNLCSSNGIPTVVTIGPITVSSAPEAEILPIPFDPICESESVLLTSVGPPGQTVTIDGCNDTTLTYWSVEEPSGYNLVAGELGNSNGATGDDYWFGAWNPGSEAITMGFETPGTYHVWLHVGNGCGEDSTQHAIVVNPYGTVSPAQSNTVICSGATVPPMTWTCDQESYIISWSASVDIGLTGVDPQTGLGIGTVNTPDSWTVTNTLDEPLYVEVSADVSCGNMPPATWLIEVMPEINLDVGQLDLPVCSGETWSIDLETNTEGTALAWTADFPPGVSGADAGEGYVIQGELNNSTNDTQYVVYTITTPEELCPMEPQEIGVSVLPLVELPELPNLTFCPGEAVELEDYETSIEGIVWSWQNTNSDVGLGASGTGVLTGFDAGENSTGGPIASQVTVYAQLADCPAEEITFELTLNPLPESTFEVAPNGGVSCIDGQGQIVATTNAQDPAFSWNGPDIVNSSAGVAEVGAPGDYSVVITNGVTGCSATFQVQVLPAAPVSITDIMLLPPSCHEGNDGSIDVFVSGGSSIEFEWTPSDIQFSGGYAEGLSAGTYGVVVTNNSECADSITITLEDYPEIDVSLIQSIDSECGELNGLLEVTGVGGQGGYTYHWTGDGHNATLDGIDAGWYEVEVSDTGGCSTSEIFELDCYPLTPIVISQLVTPNQDGYNDTWFIENLWMYPDNQVQIFNRWGTEIFRDEHYQNDWAGTWGNGIGSDRLLPAGTYYFLIDTKKKSQDMYRGFLELQHEPR